MRAGRPDAPPGPRQMARRVLLVWLAGAAVRLALLRVPRLWFDEATTGLLGLAVLRGDFPVYFFGQPFMGALDGYLAAPLYAGLGVSARTLELLPVLLAVAWLGLVLRLSWETYGPRAALLTGFVLVIPPDFLLIWSHEARNHYPLTLVLGTLALLLAVRAPTAPPARAILHGGLLGLVLGLAFWTNFLSLVYWPSVALLSMRAGLRRGLTGAVVVLPPFVLGSLPHWVYGLRHGTAWPPAGEWIGLPALDEHLGFLLRVSWPILVGVPAVLRETAAGALVALGLTALYVAAGIAAVRAARAGTPATRAMSLALLALVLVNTAIAPRAVRAVRLETAYPTDAPRGVRLEGSEDGATWRPLAAKVSTEGRLIWGGVALLRMGVHATRLDFPPVALRALRLVLTRGDSVFDWSIHQLAVYGPD